MPEYPHGDVIIHYCRATHFYSINNNNNNEATTTAADTGLTTISTNSTHQADLPEYRNGHVIIHYCRVTDFYSINNNNNNNEATTAAADTGPTTISTNSTHQADLPEYPHGFVFIYHAELHIFTQLTTTT